VNSGLQEETFGLGVDRSKERVPYFTGWANWVVGVPRLRAIKCLGGALLLPCACASHASLPPIPLPPQQ